jgi:hypothetical protein
MKFNAKTPRDDVATHPARMDDGGWEKLRFEAGIWKPESGAVFGFRLFAFRFQVSSLRFRL